MMKSNREKAISKSNPSGYYSTAQGKYSRERIEHWDKCAYWLGKSFDLGKYYRRRVAEIYQVIIPPGQRVLELGCGMGDLLHALMPSMGVGIDFSAEMIKLAKSRYPDLQFFQADAHDFKLDEKFDYIVLSDLINDLWDVQLVLNNIRHVCTHNTRIVINFYSRLWQIPLDIARKLGLAKPILTQNWFTLQDIEALLKLSDFEVIRYSSEILCPLPVPFVAPLLNRFIAKLWPFRITNLTNIIVARPLLPREDVPEEPVVSVIVAARNEAGNIPNIFKRISQIAGCIELIFVEGGSADNTYESIKREMAKYPEIDCKLFRQTGTGKGDAVRLGFEKATGDILMILDADLTVLPEVLPRFAEALLSGKGEFINGVRLVYPMQKQAMRFFNLIGNKFFSMAFSWILGQPIKDTLCGTKALWKDQYELICANRSYFGDFDPFGDFDLIFGSAKLNLKIIDLPVRYQERTYGTTNIQRWRHGVLLLKMVLFGAKKIKFL